MPAALYYSREMVLALPEDGNRYETVWGELLVTPAPRLRHQEVLKRLLVQLELYLRAEPVGRVLPSPADISWGPDILVQPDLFVVAREQAGATEWSQVTRLLFVVEVLNPSSVRADRYTKRKLYQSHGVGTYWAVDPDAEMVEVWSPEAAFPAVERDRVAWHPAGAREPLVIELAELFRPT
ncbi:MAG: Uma2 family endonuclease [Gemmatimonadales bacterium]